MFYSVWKRNSFYDRYLFKKIDYYWKNSNHYRCCFYSMKNIFLFTKKMQLFLKSSKPWYALSKRPKVLIFIFTLCQITFEMLLSLYFFFFLKLFLRFLRVLESIKSALSIFCSWTKLSVSCKLQNFMKKRKKMLFTFEFFYIIIS